MLRGSRASLNSAFLPGALSIVAGEMHAFAQTAVGSSEQLPTLLPGVWGRQGVLCNGGAESSWQNRKTRVLI